MKLSVIICTYNRIELLPYCFNSILNQSYSENDVEYILINNNSTDSTKEYVLSFLQEHQDLGLRYVEEFDQGLSNARNRGIREAKGKWVAFIDDDAIMYDNYVQEVINVIDSNPSFIAFGGKIIVHFLGNPPKWQNPYVNSLFGYFDKGDSSFKFKSNSYPRGSNMIFKKLVFDDIGFFDPNLGRLKKNLGGNEEKDLFYRIFKAGYTVMYLPNLVIKHIAPPERTTKSFVRLQANGIGISEKTRTLSKSKFAYSHKLFLELLKWTATIGIALLYSLKLEWSKAFILLKFRFWITSGLLGKKYV